MIRDRKVILFLDFDGTLSPIAGDPDEAILPPDVKHWVWRLSRSRDVRVSIVTGRALTDIRRRVALRKIIYAANHGMEIHYDGKYLLRKGRSYRKPIGRLAARLQSSLSDMAGVIVENKGLSVAIHYRMADPKFHASVKRTVARQAVEFIAKYDLQLTAGKMILEVRPAKFWNKGKAVLWIWRRMAPGRVPIYIGDDITDEDAFLAVRPHGLGIRIGKKRNSHARYHVNSIYDLIHLPAT